MHWKHVALPARRLDCAYCGEGAEFAHAFSYEHDGETLSLYACPTCRSLIYDLEGIDAPLVPTLDTITPDVWRNARYVIEAGFSARYVAMCALAAIPDLSADALRGYSFVDVGAGFGMSSYLVKTLFGMPTVTVEPSFMGKLSHEILGLDVHRAYFEHLPPALLAGLSQKPCCLHLNSVVEHLVDPYAVLKDMVGRVRVESLAIVVPDAEFLSLDTPFVVALPFLAPRDHRHLPTREGAERLLRRLGFPRVHVHQEPGLLIAVGSHSPIAFPGERTIALAEQALAANLCRHPNPHVVEGGLSRLLPIAVGNGAEPVVADVARRMAYELHAPAYLKRIADGTWDELPFHLGPSCYWLALDAFRNGRNKAALSLLTLVRTFANLLAKDHPSLAMTAVQFRWAGALLQACVQTVQGERDAARATLNEVVASRADAMNGATAAHIEHALAALRGLDESDAARAEQEKAQAKAKPRAPALEPA